MAKRQVAMAKKARRNTGILSMAAGFLAVPAAMATGSGGPEVLAAVALTV